MTVLPPRTVHQATAVLQEWGEAGGFDIITACRFSPVLASAGLAMIEAERWRFMPLERLTDLLTALASSPVAASRLLELINEDMVPMFALTGEGFTALNRTLEWLS